MAGKKKWKKNFFHPSLQEAEKTLCERLISFIRMLCVGYYLFSRAASNKRDRKKSHTDAHAHQREREEKGKDENVGRGKKGDGKMLRQTSGESGMRRLAGTDDDGRVEGEDEGKNIYIHFFTSQCKCGGEN